MDYLETCETKAEEYADRVAGTGVNYDDAYDHYLLKCIKEYKDKDEEPDEIDFN